MSKFIEPEKLVDLSKDYYAILGIDRDAVPRGGTFQEKQRLNQILAEAFRAKAPIAHPDHGGSEQAFFDVCRAQQIIEDPILRAYYESGGAERLRMVEDGDSKFEVDWSKIGTYRRGTPQDTIGHALYGIVCSRKEELNLKAAFRPREVSDNYEWDWVLGGKTTKLALSLVADEGEVLRLTDGNAVKADSLPFKIYICLPRAALYFAREECEYTIGNNGKPMIVGGQMLGAIYSDLNMLETTSFAEAEAYCLNGGDLEIDLDRYLSGQMVEEQKEKDKKAMQQQWVSEKEAKDIDKAMLQDILRRKTFEVVPDDKGADFLEYLPD